MPLPRAKDAIPQWLLIPSMARFPRHIRMPRPSWLRDRQVEETENAPDSGALPSSYEPPKKPRFWESPELMAFLTIMGLLLAAFPIFESIYKGRAHFEDYRHLIFFGPLTIIVAVYCVVLIHRTQKANHEIRIRHNRALILQTRNADLETQLNLSEEIRATWFENRDKKELELSDLFLKIARLRAAHSFTLYALQSRILELSSNKRLANAIFETSWTRQRNFLLRYCHLVSEIYTLQKDEVCCASVKVFFDAAHANDHSLIRTHYGVARSVEPARVLYKTIARCTRSLDDGRTSDETTESRVLDENFIFRRLFLQQYQWQRFCTSDIDEEVAAWRKGEASGDYPKFKYPDERTLNYYRSLSVAPILFNGTIEHPEGSTVRSEQLELFIGVLSIDSKAKVSFDSEWDRKTTDELVNGIISSFFEYFRCVKHLERRIS